MRFKKYLFLIAMAALLFLSCSCANGGKIEISPSDKSLVDLASTTYDTQELSDIISFNGSMRELNDKYPIECLRKDGDIYRVSYLGQGCIAVLQFDSAGDTIVGNIHAAQLLRSDFDELAEGRSLDDVMQLDPNGDYGFLYTGRNDVPRASSHYTKDGYRITIAYDASNIITGINEEPV